MQRVKPIIKYKTGYQFQTVVDYSVQTSVFNHEDVETHFLTLAKNGILKIRQGYAWDGPSGPTLSTKTFMRGSLVHDALYQLIRMELLPKGWRILADKELRRICLEDRMWCVRAWYVYHSVRIFAASAADPENKKLILTAP